MSLDSNSQKENEDPVEIELEVIKTPVKRGRPGSLKVWLKHYEGLSFLTDKPDAG